MMRHFCFRATAIALALFSTVAMVSAEEIKFMSRFDSHRTAVPTQLVSMNGDDCCADADRMLASCGCDSWCSGIEGGVELLFLNLWANHGAGVRNGGNSWFTSDPDTTANMRYWVGYRGAGGLGVRGRYFSQYSQIGAGQTTNYFDVQLTDVEATALMSFGKWDVDLFGGIRIGDLRWSDELGGDGYIFTGAGLTLGGTIRRELFGNVGLVGGVRTSVLLGQTKEVVNTDESSNTFANLTELRLGVDWRRDMAGGNLVLGVAWEQQMYTGLSGNVDNDIDPEDVDISLGGPVLSISFQR